MRLLAIGYCPPSSLEHRLWLPSILTCSKRHTIQSTIKWFWQQKALQPRMNQAETDGVPPSVYILGCKHGKVEQKSAPVF